MYGTRKPEAARRHHTERNIEESSLLLNYTSLSADCKRSVFIAVFNVLNKNLFLKSDEMNTSRIPLLLYLY